MKLSEIQNCLEKCKDFLDAATHIQSFVKKTTVKDITVKSNSGATKYLYVEDFTIEEMNALNEYMADIFKTKYNGYLFAAAQWYQKYCRMCKESGIEIEKLDHESAGLINAK